MPKSAVVIIDVQTGLVAGEPRVHDLPGLLARVGRAGVPDARARS